MLAMITNENDSDCVTESSDAHLYNSEPALSSDHLFTGVPWRNPGTSPPPPAVGGSYYITSSPDTTSSTNDNQLIGHDDNQLMMPERPVNQFKTPPRSRRDKSLQLSESMLVNEDHDMGSDINNNKEPGSHINNNWAEIESTLTRDLSAIVPTFEFNGSCSGMFTHRRFYHDSTSDDTSSSHAPDLTSTMSNTTTSNNNHVTMATPRYSWSGNLDIISDTESLQYLSAVEGRQRRAKRKKREAASDRVMGGGEDVVRFESQCRRVPRFSAGMVLGVKSESLSTELLLEKDRLQVLFIVEKSYLLCSSSTVRRQKRKVSLRLLDIVNVLVLSGTNTLIIQYQDVRRSGLPNSSSTGLLSSSRDSTLKSSCSTSLNLNTTLDRHDHDLNELEVGRFNNCETVAMAILRRRQHLLPRSILRGSLNRRGRVQPVIVHPVQIGFDVEEEDEDEVESEMSCIMECVTYVSRKTKYKSITLISRYHLFITRSTIGIIYRDAVSFQDFRFVIAQGEYFCSSILPQ
eukprot:sb/3463883/